MEKKRLSPIPPLSPERLQELSDLERVLARYFDTCDGFTFNVPKAKRILRAMTVPAILIQVEYYESLPDYEPRWIPQVVEEAIESILNLLPPSGWGKRHFLKGEMLEIWTQGRYEQEPEREPTHESPANSSSQLDSLRLECNLSYEDLAGLVKLDATNVARHIRNESRPHLRNIAAYERVFSKILGRQVLIDKTQLKAAKRRSAKAKRAV